MSCYRWLSLLSATLFWLGNSDAPHGACRALGAQGQVVYQGQPIGHWAVEINNKSPAARANAVVALADIVSRQPVPDSGTLRCLGMALRDPDQSVRVKAAGCIGDLALMAPEVMEPLKHAVNDGDAATALAARDAVQRIAQKKRDRIQAEITRLDDTKPNARAAAALQLSLFGPGAKEAVPKLVLLLRDEYPLARTQAVMALASIGPDAAAAATRPLAELLDSGAGVDKVNAVMALGQMGPAAKETVPLLVRELQEKHLRPQSVALVGVDPRGTRWMPLLKELLASAQKPERQAAADILRYIVGSKPSIAADEPRLDMGATLIAALDDDDQVVRWSAVLGLAAMRPFPAEFLPALTRALNDRDSNVKQAAAQGLRKLTPAGIQSLCTAADSKSDKTRMTARHELGLAVEFSARQFVEAIGRVDSPERPRLPEIVETLEIAPQVIVPLLIKAMKTNNPNERTHAMGHLGQIAGFKGTVPALAGIRSDEMIDLRARGIKALAEIKVALQGAEEPLRLALDDENADVRKRAASALKFIGVKP